MQLLIIWIVVLTSGWTAVPGIVETTTISYAPIIEQVFLEDTEADGSWTAGGVWTIDDVLLQNMPPPIKYTLPFADNMENPEANRRAVNAWRPVTTTASSPVTSWQGTASDSALILVDQLDLTTAVSPTLTFQQQFVLPAGSVGQVMVLPENDTRWRPALTVTVPISGWTEVSVDLSEYAGQKIGLSFYLSEVTTGTAGTQAGYVNQQAEAMLSARPRAVSF